jgi:predicted ester cyclase
MSEDNKALVRRFYDEIFTKKNANAIDEICSPDFVDRNPMPGQSPGRQGMKDAFGGFLHAFPDMAVTIEEMIAERDLVAARFTVTGTHQGELMGAKPTGKKITVHGIDMMRIVGGNVVEATHYGDEIIALMKLGVRLPV